MDLILKMEIYNKAWWDEEAMRWFDHKTVKINDRRAKEGQPPLEL